MSNKGVITKKLTKAKMLGKINSCTIQLNNLTLSISEQNRLRKKRSQLMKLVLPLVKPNESVFLVPFCDQPVYVSKHVAIIGNAAEILGKQQGSIIDTYSTVIRFNSGITKGYEADVGKRLTHLFCTADYYNNKNQRTAADGQICPIKLNTTELRNVNVIGIVVNSTKLTSLRDFKQFDISVRLSAYFNNLKNQNHAIKAINPQLVNNLKFTAGISITISLVDLGLIPRLFGFSHTLDTSYRTYYWPDIVRDKKTNKTHDFEKEYKVLDHLKNNKLIVFH